MNFNEIIEDLRASAENIQACGYQGADDALNRFLSALDQEPLYSLLNRFLPSVDFISWIQKAKKTASGMAGSGHLDWPTKTLNRIAMQIALLRALHKGEPIDLITFMTDFFYAGSNLNITYIEYVQRFFNPFLSDLGRVIDKAIESEQVMEPKDKNEKSANVDPKKVFVVHGRNTALRDSMFTFLRAIGINPIEWSEAVALAPGASPYIGDILSAAFSIAQAIVVLFSGDDEAKLRDIFISGNEELFEKELTPQARPNVLFEAGIAFGSCPERTVLVEVGRLRPFSDIGGRHTIRLNNSSERRQELAQRLKKAGCEVNLDGTQWHTAGNFESIK